MASRVRSDTLRAPVTEQSRLRAEYSSSERRTLIILLRGFRTVIRFKMPARNSGPRLSLGEVLHVTKGGDDNISANSSRSRFESEFRAGFAPVCPRLLGGP